MNFDEERKSFGDAIFELVVLLTRFFLTGAGIGFVQGLLAFRQLRHGGGLFAVFGMAAMAAGFGAGVALLIGTALYVFIGHRQTVVAFSSVARTSFLTGIASAYILGFTYFGWVSGFITPLATIIAATRFHANPQIEPKPRPSYWSGLNRRKLLLWLPLAIVLLVGLYSLENLTARAYRPDALLYAAEEGNLEVARDLLDKGTNPNIADSSDGTPIMYAAAHGRTTVVQLLLARGAQLNAPATMGRTPLMWAARNGHDETVKFLLEKGARTDLRDEDGKTALMLAAEERHKTTTEILKAAGAVE